LTAFFNAQLCLRLRKNHRSEIFLICTIFVHDNVPFGTEKAEFFEGFLSKLLPRLVQVSG